MVITKDRLLVLLKMLQEKSDDESRVSHWCFFLLTS